MSTEHYKRLIHRVFEDGVSRGDWPVIDEVFALHNVDYSLSEPLPPERIKRSLQDLRTRLPDLQVEIQRLVAEGETVTTIERWSGTSAATGERVEGTVFHLFRFENGQVVEEWSEGWSWLDELYAGSALPWVSDEEHQELTELVSPPLFTTRAWIFTPGNGARGHAALDALDQVAGQIAGARVRLFQDRDRAERFVTIGQWPTDASFDEFMAHPDIEQVAAVLESLLAERYPTDDAIFMHDVTDR